MEKTGSLAYMAIVVLVNTGTTRAAPMAPLPVMELDHSMVLDKQGDFYVSWSPREKDIIFEVRVASTGYVGLGFSPNGGMKGADIILGWVDDDMGEVYLHDRYSSGYGVPKVDESQDVELLGGYQNDTHTILRFTRPWDTCDREEDFLLSDDTVRLIWSFSYEDPTDETTMQIHNRRGTRSIYLNEPRFTLPEISDDIMAFDLLAPNVSLPNDIDTLYWCKLYKMPELPNKAHIIGYLPLVQEKNVEHVHHIVVYECLMPDEEYYEKWSDVRGVQCFTKNMPQSWNTCRSPLLAWAVGSDGEMFPEHVGFPVGGEYGRSTYFMMEMHYDNPNMRQDVVDASGLRVLYTEKLRENEAGNLIIGSDVSGNIIIPPGQNWLTVGHCISECTKQSLPTDGINIFHGLLHAHLLGSALQLRQIRNGSELPTVFKDMAYDFNYQQVRVLKEEMKILPGDHLIIECGYDSKNRKVPTYGGLGTNEEMCVAYLSYYPRSPLIMCSSQPSIQNIYESLGIQDIYDKDAIVEMKFKFGRKQDEEKERQLLETLKQEEYTNFEEVFFRHMHKMVVAKSPEKYENKTLYDILSDDAIWQDSEWVKQLQDLSAKGRHHTSCYSRKVDSMRKVQILSMIDYPSFIPLEPEPNECGNN